MSELPVGQLWMGMIRDRTFNKHSKLRLVPSMFLLLIKSIVWLAFLSLTVQGHGQISSHKTRMAGPKSKEVCGKAFNDLWNGEYDLNDRVGPLFSFEPHNRSKDWPSECKWYQCQGKQFEDNRDNVYTFPVGHHLHLEIFILAAHEGTANISVIDLERNEVIPGAQLRYWGEGYAKLRTYGDGPYPPADQVNFVVEMPNLDGQCSQPGQCAIQWWWWGKQSARDQYYESCIDFVQPPHVIVNEESAQEVFVGSQDHHGH